MVRTPMTTWHRVAGFTLPEMLVYIAILTITTGVAITTLLSLSDQINESRAERALMQSVHTTADRFLHVVRSADSVNVLASTLETSPGVLSVLGGATTTRFLLSGGALVLQENGNDIGPLTHESVTVDSLVFYHYDNLTTEMVRMELTLTATFGDSVVTRDVTSAAVLRGSYE